MGVPEWLSGMTRNHVGFARAGSNPAAHVFSLEQGFSTNFFFFFDCINEGFIEINRQQNRVYTAHQDSRNLHKKTYKKTTLGLQTEN